MTKSTDSQSGKEHGDSRLREFLRRAGPILAAERGWNERSQLMIKSLARDLNLPDDVYELAVTRLQEGELPFDERYTSYEHSFIKYLNSQFTKSDIKVLTAAHEATALRVAKREYQISPVRARQLVRLVADQLEISRVSKRDATQHITLQIDETVGDATYVSDSVRGRIFETGKKWGLESGQVEVLISNRIEANRQSPVSPYPWRIRIIAAVASLLAMLAIGWGVWLFFGNSLTPVDSSEKEKPVEAVGGDSQPSFRPEPSWWTEETKIAFRSFTANTLAARFPHELLKSSDPRERLSGYDGIVRLVRESSGQFRKQCTGMFARFFREESVDVSSQMAAKISGMANLPSDRLPSNTRPFYDWWRAHDLLIASLESSTGTAKTRILESAAMQVTGLSTNHPEFPNVSADAVAAIHWQYLSTRSYSEPQAVALLMDSLGELTRNESGSSSEGEFTTVISLLTIQPESWSQMRPTLERVVEFASDDQLRELYVRKTNSGVPEFQTWLSSRFAERLGIVTDQLTSSRIDETVAQALNLNPQPTGIFPVRWKRLVEDPLYQDMFAAPVTTTPQTIGNAVHLTTIAMLLYQAEQNGDHSLVAKADELWNAGPRNLAVHSSTGRLESNLPVYRRVQRRALPSDIRTMEESMKLLAQAGSRSSQANAIAFERLANVAPRFRDIPVEDAAVLARYMLQASETSELVAIERSSAQMRHWPHLALAMADEIAITEGTLDQTLTCAGLLLDVQPDIIGDNWRSDISQKLLEKISRALRRTTEIQGDDNRYQWNELKSLLVSHYRIRCSAIQVPPAKTSAALLPGELAELMVERLERDSFNTDPSGDPVSVKVAASRYLAENEMQLFALHGRVIAQHFMDVAEVPETDQITLPQAILNNELDLLRGFSGSAK